MSGQKHDPSAFAAILTDVTKCVGCQKCVAACVDVNKTGDPVPYIYANPDGLSGTRWTSVLRVNNRYVRKQCLHCVDPSCVSACLVGAITKEENGAVIYNKDKCIGCRYCMIACPFSIPRYQWDRAIPFINKCVLCFDRLEKGQRPACTTACPYGATIFGTRAELIEEANKRIKDNPGKYIPRIWGDNDYGGTSVLYISDVPLDTLGFPPSDEKSSQNIWRGKTIPEMNKPVVMATPFIFVGVYSSMAGISWILNRRIKRAEEARKKLAGENRDEIE